MTALSCPVPFPAKDRILLGHGSGGKLSAELLRDVILPTFHNEALAKLDDQAIVSVGRSRLAISTDSFVVKPLFFPGGDIGSLAVYGTINDLAMGGARPLYLSTAFILEEGFAMQDFCRIVTSMQRAAEQAGVEIVTGDTKVVEKGSGDGLFVNTTGLGVIPEDVVVSSDQARPGDCIVLSGSIGEHGIAILARREGLEFETTIQSDTAPLHALVAAMLGTTRAIRCLRDPTRGGLSSALNEIAARSQVGFAVNEGAIPISEEVRGACELLGLDPLYVANEGKLVAVVAPEAAEAVVEAMRHDPQGKDARIIGTVTAENAGLVTMRTILGTTRIVDLLPGDQLPRIC